MLDIRKRLNQPTLNVGEKGKFRLLQLAVIGFSGFSIFLSLVIILYVRQIVRKPFPTLVQTNTGETVEIGFEDPAYRSPEVIENFVGETLYHLMTMTSYGDGEVSALNPNRQLAGPVKVKVGDRSGAITQQAWLASEALEAKFSNEFRMQLAQMTPPDVFNGTEEIILKIDYIKPPETVTDDDDNWAGKWTVDVIGSLKVFRLGEGSVKTIPFNKRVTVRPIKAPHIHDVEEFGTLAIALNKSQLSGLQITDIKDINISGAF